MTVDGAAQARLVLPAGEREVVATLGVRQRGAPAEVRVTVGGLGGEIEAQARVVRDRVEHLVARGHGFDLAALRADLSGRGAFDIEASGPMARLATRPRSRSRMWSGAGCAWGPLWRASGEGMDARFDVAAPEWRVSADVGLAARRQQVRATVRMDDAPLDGLSALAGQKVSGAVRGQVDATVSWERPEDAEGRLHLDALTVRGANVDFELLAPLDARLTHGLLAIDGLRAQGTGYTLDASGQLAANEKTQSKLRLSLAADLERLPLQLPAAWLGAERRRLRGRPVESSTRRRPRRAARGALGAVGRPAIEVPEALLEFQGDSVRLATSEIRVGSGRAVLDAHLPWAVLGTPHVQSPPATVDVRWSGVDVADWLASGAATGEVARLRGVLAGQASFEARGLDLSRVLGVVETGRTELTVDETLLTIEPTVMRLGRGRLDVPDLEIHSPGAR